MSLLYDVTGIDEVSIMGLLQTRLATWFNTPARAWALRFWALRVRTQTYLRPFLRTYLPTFLPTNVKKDKPSASREATPPSPPTYPPSCLQLTCKCEPWNYLTTYLTTYWPADLPPAFPPTIWLPPSLSRTPPSEKQHGVSRSALCLARALDLPTSLPNARVSNPPLLACPPGSPWSRESTMHVNWFLAEYLAVEFNPKLETADEFRVKAQMNSSSLSSNQNSTKLDLFPESMVRVPPSWSLLKVPSQGPSNFFVQGFRIGV